MAAGGLCLRKNWEGLLRLAGTSFERSYPERKKEVSPTTPDGMGWDKNATMYSTGER